MKYNIGQVLYVLLNNDTKICPVQVVEEITKKTISGETIQYIVKTNKSGNTMTLSDMDGHVFDSIDVLKQTLQDRITKTINTVVHNAIKRAEAWYDVRHEQFVEKPTDAMASQALDIKEDVENTLVTLPDGTVARLKLPTSGV